MPAVAIIGAGEVGGALAQTLAVRDRIGTIRLIDRNESVATGKALDIQQSGPIEGFGTRLVASGDLRQAIGVGVTVVADGASGETPSLDESLALLRELVTLGSETIFVAALASHCQLIERGARELVIPRARLIGSAPTAFASAIRAIVGATLDISPSQVSLSILGCPPDQVVVPWASASVGGSRLEDAASPAQLAAIQRRVTALWPPGPFGLASAAGRIVEAIVSGSRREWPCFVTLEGEFDVRGRAAAMPVQLGPVGVRRIVAPALTARERVRLDIAIGA